MVKTFDNGMTKSQEIVEYLQRTYGSANFKQLQTLRQQFYSYVTYPVAGTPNLNFFGTALGNGGETLQTTNLPKANSFGQVHFLLKSIQFQFHIGDPGINTWDASGLDANTLVSDFLMGFMTAGFFSLKIQNRDFIQLPLPFQYLGFNGGSIKKLTAGVRQLTLTEASPNTYLTLTSSQPAAEVASKEKGAYQVDPNILIEAEQNFQCSISFPDGAVPVISTGIVVDATNPLKVGIIFDGIVFRPMQ